MTGSFGGSSIIRRGVAGGLLCLSLVVSVVSLARGHNNCDPYDESLTGFVIVPPILIAAALVFLLARTPRRTGWVLGPLLGGAFLAWFIFFTDLMGACAD
jgi:energy-coupling factor transporter transmembrane protein EcfT